MPPAWPFPGRKQLPQERTREIRLSTHLGLQGRRTGLPIHSEKDLSPRSLAGMQVGSAHDTCRKEHRSPDPGPGANGVPQVQPSRHFSTCPCEPGLRSSLTPSTKSRWHPLGRLPCAQKPLPSARGLALSLPKTSSQPPLCFLIRPEAGVLKDPRKLMWIWETAPQNSTKPNQYEN